MRVLVQRRQYRFQCHAADRARRRLLNQRMHREVYRTSAATPASAGDSDATRWSACTQEAGSALRVAGSLIRLLPDEMQERQIDTRIYLQRRVLGLPLNIDEIVTEELSLPEGVENRA